LKLDLLNKEINDPYVRENFVRLKRELEAQQILGGYFIFFEKDLTSVGVKVPIKHNLSFVPQDIIVLSVEGSRSIYFNYEDFDSTNLYVTLTKPCRIRFLAGNYKDRAYGGSKKDFAFVSPPSVDAPIWYSGAGNPTSGLGLVGDFYLNTTNSQIFLKTTDVLWTSQGYLSEFTSAVGSQLLEIVPLTPAANVWTLVPLTTINKIADVTIFDAANEEEINIAWRKVSGGTQVEILSKKVNTYTIHVEGYKT
jgi:hypothetical protein